MNQASECTCEKNFVRANCPKHGREAIKNFEDNTIPVKKMTVKELQDKYPFLRHPEYLEDDPALD